MKIEYQTFDLRACCSVCFSRYLEAFHRRANVPQRAVAAAKVPIPICPSAKTPISKTKLVIDIILKHLQRALQKMPPSPLTMTPGSISRLTCTSNLYRRSLLRLPRLPRQAPSRSSNPTFSTQQPPQSHTTTRPNYRLALVCGLVAVAATWTVTHSKPLRLDAPPNNNNQRRDDALSSLTSGAQVEITTTGQEHGSDVEQIPTGTSTIPYFPRSIWLPRSGNASEQGKSAALPAGMGAAQEEEEYRLLGLGVRKVSFLRIQVYVVGLYVAKSDMGLLQEKLVRTSSSSSSVVGNNSSGSGSVASTLVQGEKESLKKTLLDPDGSTSVWTAVLKESGIKSAVRIVPTRNTNFSHMRDGWLRGIDLRSKGAAAEYESEAFQAAVAQFKSMLGGRGSVGKGKVILLGRATDGALRAWVENENEDAESKAPGARERMTLLGTIADERISRLVWLGYLAGPHIASEDARQSVVEGVMEMVERPVGTIETQVI